jgi:hypothetical protein
MFMKDRQRSRSLADGDEFLCSLCRTVSKKATITSSCEMMKPTLSTFSGLMWGGGGMLGRPHCAIGYWIDADYGVRLSLKTFCESFLETMEWVVFR